MRTFLAFGIRGFFVRASLTTKLLEQVPSNWPQNPHSIIIEQIVLRGGSGSCK